VKIYKTTVAGLALVASLAFVAGCKSDSSSSGGSSTASSAPAANPAGELAAAVLKLTSATHKYTVDVENTDIVGMVDPATKSVKIALQSADAADTITADLISIGTDMYLKISGLGLPGLDETKWLHVDGSKVKSLHMFGISSLTDPVGVLALTSAVKDVQKTGDRTYKGTFDLTKPASGITDEDIKAMAEKAKNIPFEATLDAQGNLVGFTFTVPAFGTEKETPVKMAISDHGSKFDIAKPDAAQVVEAPDLLYQLLNAPS